MSKLAFYSPCTRCNAKTRHDVLCESSRSGGDDRDFEESYAVIQCLGCEKKSFRYVFRDHDRAFQTSEDEWETPETIRCYPQHDPSHLKIDVSSIPDLVREIYEESFLAINEGARTLAGLGLRGTIEAICNERVIGGRTLADRISKLASGGYISANDAERLHAIRFLGNDAAHDIKKPTREQISVALKIINHLIQSVYLLEREANGKLDTVVRDYIDFKKLISKNLKTLSPGDELPIAAIVGKDARRLGNKAPEFETQLIEEINCEQYNELSIGSLKEGLNSKQSQQHFVVNFLGALPPRAPSFLSNRRHPFSKLRSAAP